MNEVIWFRAQFPTSPKPYTYVAVEIGGLWYLTGKETRGRTWKGMLRWFEGEGIEIILMKRATEWEEVGSGQLQLQL